MDGEKVRAAAEAAVRAAARAGAPAEGEEAGRAPRGGEPVRDGGPARGNRLRVEGRPAPRRGPAFAPAAAPGRLTGRAFPAPV
ncbi:MAG: hypothetical protein ACUVSK_06550 [Desulfotomaculales bacterium]